MRLPTLSPTRIALFLACPVKYRWTYLDSRGKWFMKSKSYYSFGTTLHKVLERFHDSGDTGVTDIADIQAALDENWIEAGYTSPEEMAEAFGEGREILEEYVREELGKKKTSHTLFLERQFRYKFDRFNLMGRIDRIEEYESGDLEIIDYKSGRSQVEANEVLTDIAMSCYQLLVSKAYPDRKVSATIISLRSGSQATASLSPEELAAFESDLINLADRIIDTDYNESKPILKPICGNCDFVKLCLQDQDFAESWSGAQETVRAEPTS